MDKLISCNLIKMMKDDMIEVDIEKLNLLGFIVVAYKSTLSCEAFSLPKTQSTVFVERTYFHKNEIHIFNVIGAKLSHSLYSRPTKK